MINRALAVGRFLFPKDIASKGELTPWLEKSYWTKISIESKSLLRYTSEFMKKDVIYNKTHVLYYIHYLCFIGRTIFLFPIGNAKSLKHACNALHSLTRKGVLEVAPYPCLSKLIINPHDRVGKCFSFFSTNGGRWSGWEIWVECRSLFLL